MKIGMVLSGGGAKGAYQIGLFQAMEELGLRSQVTAISGCSIGALNALLFAGTDPAAWDSIWRSMRYEDLMLREAAAPGTTATEGGITRKLTELVSAIRQRGIEIGSLAELITQSELLPFSQDGMRALLRHWVNFDRLPTGPALWFCAYNLEREQPEYFPMGSLPQEEVVELAMASAAIPMMFPTVAYGGCHYCDGGITPPYSKHKNADKIPVRPLEALGCDLVIVVYLSHYDKADLTGFPPSTQLLELYPSAPLEMVKGAGTMNLSRETLADNLRMGYNDGLAALAPLLLDQSRGRSGVTALASHMNYNRLLLEEKLPLLQRAEDALKNKLSEVRREQKKV